MERAEVVICGAGITGLALARELVLRGRESVLVLDKEDAPGQHASGRNSGVLHAGVYYAPDSLKAKVCLAGNRAMKQWCRERGLPLLESGKVIVARNEGEIPALLELLRRATANGADVALIDEQELAELEPHARTTGQALLSRETAQVDPRAVVSRLAQELADTGRVRFLHGVRALGPVKPDGHGLLRTTRGPVAYGLLVNAAGAFADKLARAFGKGKGYALIPFKGVYRNLRPERAHLCQGNIYPVPDIANPFLGVHFTRSASGSVHLGPTAIPAFGRENYGILRGISAEAPAILAHDAKLFFRNKGFRAVALSEPRKYWARAFFKDARQLVPELRFEDLMPSAKVGIRPQLVDTRTAQLVMDFVLQDGPRQLHVLNAISPAFTASFAFAKLLADRLETLD